jgi:hypothetical protein
MTINRSFGAVLLTLACLWLASFVVSWRQEAEDRAFYQQRVQPYLDGQTRRSEALRQALSDRQKGPPRPLPRLEERPTDDPLDAWVHRLQRRSVQSLVRFDCVAGFLATFVVWIVFLLATREILERKWQDPNRPAVSDAGDLIAAFIQTGGVLVAKPTNRRRVFRADSKQEIQVDGRRRTAVFREFTFITTFVGNRPRGCTELDFADILGARIICDRSGATLHLRTTKGRVAVRDKFESFQTLAGVFFDSVEVNRMSPEKYRAALAREPVVHTPWWGWLPILALAVFIGWAVWRVMQN